VPGQEVILRLFNNRPDEVESLGHSPGLSDLLGRPLTGAPVESPAVVNNVVHGPHGFLDGRGDVGAVAVENVDVVHVEALERGLGALHYVLTREALVVGALTAPEDLGRNDDVGALPPELPDRLPHDLLGAAVGVDLGIVEEVDAVVAAGLEQRLGLLHVQLVPEAHPRAVRQLAHLQPRSPKVPVLHRAGFSSARKSRERVRE